MTGKRVLESAILAWSRRNLDIFSGGTDKTTKIGDHCRLQHFRNRRIRILKKRNRRSVSGIHIGNEKEGL